MATFREVYGVCKDVNQKPLANKQIFFDYYNLSQSQNTFFSNSRNSVFTNNLGYFSIKLWCNEEGDSSSYYKCILDERDTFDFVLPIGTSAIALDVLRTGGITPINPQYQSLLSYIQSSIGIQSNKESFVAINNQTSFVLQNSVPSPHLTQVFVNGVQQNFPGDYSINGSTVNWVSAIALRAGWIIDVYY